MNLAIDPHPCSPSHFSNQTFLALIYYCWVPFTSADPIYYSTFITFGYFLAFLLQFVIPLIID
jgi:hypothetical protein